MTPCPVELLCTLGPASLNDRTLCGLASAGASLLRINLSHTRLDDVERIVKFIQRRSSIPICLDTEGAQLRTGPMVDGKVVVRENGFITAHARPVPGDPLNISFCPGNVVGELEVGDFISIDFNAVLSQVVQKDADGVLLRILNGGEIGQNKAVTVMRDLYLDPLTEKDIAAISIGRKLGIRHYALSFAHRASDVDLIREHAGPGAVVISKIECLSGLQWLDEIALRSDALLIDRGDLSREVPIEQIPAAQKMIIRTAKSYGRKVYVATNLLESMTSSPAPTRAEVNDIYNTLADGADGLVLAAETAIGRFPVQCANMVVRVAEQFRKRTTTCDFPSQPTNLLTECHGGRLACRPALSPTEAAAATTSLPEIVVSDEELTDVEQMTRGTYSPLTGFLDAESLESVLEHRRLPSGLAWTMPIVLAVPCDCAKRYGKGDRVVLTRSDGLKHSLLEITSSFRFDTETLVRKWFGTDRREHPGVARVLARGNHFLSGEVTLIKELPFPHRRYDLTPSQLRMVFAHKGWSRVVGFHSRNVVHRGHEAVQLAALERTHADGLLINPVLGSTRRGDFLPDAILNSYQAMLDFELYPAGRVVLASLITYPRFAGPREAVFNALCRKNMGCSHFIVGRDHAGVGGFYADADCRTLFEELGDLGIEPVFFDAIGYDTKEERYVELNLTRDATSISGTEVRQALSEGRMLPTWMMRAEVQQAVRAQPPANARLLQE